MSHIDEYGTNVYCNRGGCDVPHEHTHCNGQGCTSVDAQKRTDAYNIFTGYYCDDCYENNYPYRKDRYYDFLDAGEYLDDDY